MRPPSSALLAVLAVLAASLSCAGPGFQAEAIWGESRAKSLELRSSVPYQTLPVENIETRRRGVRIAVGGPDYSARGYGQFFAEDLELTTPTGPGRFDDLGAGVGVLGRQRLSGDPDEGPVLILPYRFGVNYVWGSGQGMATPTGTFGDLEYLEWEGDAALGVGLASFDLVAGYALSVIDAKVDIITSGVTDKDGMSGTNGGFYVAGAYSFGDLPWRLKARVGFGDLETYRFNFGLFY